MSINSLQTKIEGSRIWSSELGCYVVKETDLPDLIAAAVNFQIEEELDSLVLSSTADSDLDVI